MTWENYSNFVLFFEEERCVGQQHMSSLLPGVMCLKVLCASFAISSELFSLITAAWVTRVPQTPIYKNNELADA